MSLKTLVKRSPKGTISLTKSAESKLDRLDNFISKHVDGESHEHEKVARTLATIFKDRNFRHLHSNLIFEIAEIIVELRFMDDLLVEVPELIKYLQTKLDAMLEQKNKHFIAMSTIRRSQSRDGLPSYLIRNNRTGDCSQWVDALLSELDAHYNERQYFTGFYATRIEIYQWLISELDRTHQKLEGHIK